jgi:hypothetical protein
MSLFKDLFSSSSSQKDSSRDPLQDSSGRSRGPETMPVKMNLEERMAFRRELLFETIRASLNMRFIAPHTYRFKVMRTDKRGHCFVVMLDMSPTFMDSKAGQHAQLAETAALLTKNASTKYGLIVGGVYWRVDETLDVSVANWARPSAPVVLEHPGSTPEERRLANIEKFEQVTADEMAEFEAAWQKDSAIQIGDRTYSSDLAPLAEEPPHK